jgi:hypothetical protein
MPPYTSRAGRRPLALIRAALSVLAARCGQAARLWATSVCAFTSSPPPGHASANATRQTLTSAEFATVRASSAYELVFQLRPDFLRTVPGDTGARIHPTVFIDDSPAGPLPVLSDIPAIITARIHYLPPAEAARHYGPGHAAGIIDVRTRR